MPVSYLPSQFVIRVQENEGKFSSQIQLCSVVGMATEVAETSGTMVLAATSI